jgi:hypothetical protein
MTGFTTPVVATTFKYAEARPDHVHQWSQIFRAVTDKILTQDVLYAADQPILEKIKRLRSSPVTIQDDAVPYQAITF